MIETVIFYNSLGLRLVGDLHKAKSKNIIIMAHGFTNNRSSQGRFDKLSKKLNEHNYNVLKFDFSGCGESDQTLIELENEVEDLSSAIRFVKEKGYDKIALFGNSLGGLVCLKAYTPDISTMVLTGPITDSMEYDWEKIYSKKQMKELKDKGFITLKSKELGIRKVSKKMLDALSNINQKDLLENIDCPILIIHGDSGEEEIKLLNRSKKALNLLNDNSRLEIIKGERHGIRNRYNEVIKLSVKWYQNNFKV